jgi:hypothetical protein
MKKIKIIMKKNKIHHPLATPCKGGVNNFKIAALSVFTVLVCVFSLVMNPNFFGKEVWAKTITVGDLPGDFVNIMGTINSGTWNGSVILGQYGGTGYGTNNAGDILFGSGGTAWNKLAAGTNGKVLIVQSGNPAWVSTSTIGLENPLTFSTGLTRAVNTITVNTSQNITRLSNLTTNGLVQTSGGIGTLSINTNTYLTTINNSNWSGTQLSVANGGTGLTSIVAGSILFGNGTSALATSSNLRWNNAGRDLGINISNPVYPLHLFDDNTTGIISITSSSTNPLWTGIRLARGDTGSDSEKWFAGMDVATDNFIIRRNETNPYTLSINNASGQITISNPVTLSNLGIGLVHADSSGLLSSSAISLTSDVSGTLTIANGGTGTTTFANGAIVVGNGSNPFTTIPNGSANWDTAYTQTLQWSGASTNLDPAAGRTSLGLGTMAVLPNTGGNTINTLGTITTGIWNATAINLATTTGTLPTNRGGTNQTSWTQYSIPYLVGTSTFGETLIGANGSLLAVNSTGTGYNWVSTSTVGELLNVTSPLVKTGLNISLPISTSTASGYLSSADWTNFNTAYTNRISTVGSNMVFAGNILNTTSTPIFNGLTLSNLNSVGVAHTNGSGVLSTGPIGLASSTDVSGILPVAYGGTGDATLTQNYLVRGNAANALSSSMIFDNGTNIGIGTSSPSSILSVQSTAGPQFTLAYDNSNAGTLGVDSSGNLTVASKASSITYIGATSTTALMIDSNGYVGIGTMTPTKKLDVVGDVNVSQAMTVGSTLNVGTTTATSTLNLVNGYIQLQPFTIAPTTCSPATKGAMAMASSTAQFCFCDGLGWKQVADLAGCVW